MAKESLGGVLLTLHNLRFFVKLMENAREQIKAGTFAKWATDWTERYNDQFRVIKKPRSMLGFFI